MTKQDKDDVKLGLIVLSIVVFCSAVWIVPGMIRLLLPGKIVKIGFDSAGGAGVNSPVKFNGVDVGDVVRVKILPEDEDRGYRVVFDCRIKRDLVIRKGSNVFVKSIGLMGEKTIDIIPAPPGAPILKKGEVLIGAQPLGFDELVQSGQTIAKNFKKVYDSIQDLTQDKELSASLKNTFSNMEKIFADIDGMQTENADDLERLWASLNELYKGPDTDMNEIMKKFSAIKSSAGDIMGENKADIEAIKKNFEEASEHLAGYNKIVEEKGILIHLKVPDEVKEALKSEGRKRREERAKKFGR